MVVLADACCCQGEGSASGGAADAFPVFGCIVEPTLADADAFWVAGAVAATLFTGCSRIVNLFCLGSSTSGNSGLLFKIVLLWCLSGIIQARKSAWRDVQ